MKTNYNLCFTKFILGLVISFLSSGFEAHAAKAPSCKDKLVQYVQAQSSPGYSAIPQDVGSKLAALAMRKSFVASIVARFKSRGEEVKEDLKMVRLNKGANLAYLFFQSARESDGKPETVRLTIADLDKREIVAQQLLTGSQIDFWNPKASVLSEDGSHWILWGPQGSLHLHLWSENLPGSRYIGYRLQIDRADSKTYLNPKFYGNDLLVEVAPHNIDTDRGLHHRLEVIEFGFSKKSTSGKAYVETSRQFMDLRGKPNQIIFTQNKKDVVVLTNNNEVAIFRRADSSHTVPTHLLKFELPIEALEQIDGVIKLIHVDESRTVIDRYLSPQGEAAFRGVGKVPKVSEHIPKFFETYPKGILKVHIKFNRIQRGQIWRGAALVDNYTFSMPVDRDQLLEILENDGTEIDMVY